MFGIVWSDSETIENPYYKFAQGRTEYIGCNRVSAAYGRKT
jgi:hypothetical protein